MNPFLSYAVSFAIALLMYQLPWSDAYPKLSGSVTIFLIATIAAAGLAAYKWKGLIKRWEAIEVRQGGDEVIITVFIYALWIADFIYEGGVPLFKILFDLPYNYRNFGVPSLHVFTVTFSSFYTLYLFQLYLRQRSRTMLLLYAVNLLAAVLIYSRAMLVFNVAGSFFIFLYCTPRIPRGLVAIGPFVFIFLLYFFGVLGTLRVSRERGTPYDSRHFLNTGKASPSFRSTGIPQEFFWSYVYLTSPIANLQTNVGYAKYHIVTDTSFSKRVVQLITNEFMFDFISKRTNQIFGLTPKIEGRIAGPFNVSTVYSHAFWHLQWYGILAMAVFILVLPFIYIRLLEPTSPYSVAGLAILCTMYFFMVYDNTIRFTGLGFQLVYPLIASLLYKFDLLRVKKPPQ